MSKSIDFNDENSNTCANPAFDSVLQAPLEPARPAARQRGHASARPCWAAWG